jgi:hypothetical protein
MPLEWWARCASPTLRFCCFAFHSLVVPAKAGTHTPCPIVLVAEAEAFCPTNAGGYGSLLSQGRRGRIRLSNNRHDFAPRGATTPESLHLSLAPSRAWGMPGARCTRSLVCSVLVAHEYSPQVHRDHPAFPHAMVLTACFVLSPVTGLVCHRHQRILAVSVRSDRHASANLTPASGRQDHTTSPSAAIVSRQRAPCRSRIHRIRPATFSRAKRCRVHRIPCPTSVTIAIRPSCGTGWRNQ